MGGQRRVWTQLSVGFWRSLGQGWTWMQGVLPGIPTSVLCSQGRDLHTTCNPFFGLTTQPVGF